MGFFSAQVSESSLSLKDTGAEINHLARKTLPYAFYRTLQVFKHFRILFMAHFMTHIPRYVYLGRYWCHNGGTSSRVQEM